MGLARSEKVKVGRIQESKWKEVPPDEKKREKGTEKNAVRNFTLSQPPGKKTKEGNNSNHNYNHKPQRSGGI